MLTKLYYYPDFVPIDTHSKIGGYISLAYNTYTLQVSEILNVVITFTLIIVLLRDLDLSI